MKYLLIVSVLFVMFMMGVKAGRLWSKLEHNQPVTQSGNWVESADKTVKELRHEKEDD